jgi:hypothetical protein
MQNEWPKVHAADYSDAIETWMVMVVGVDPKHCRSTFNEAAAHNQRAYAAMAHIYQSLRALGYTLLSSQRAEWSVTRALAEAYSRLESSTCVRVCDESGEWIDTRSADPSKPLPLGARAALAKHLSQVSRALAEASAD